MVDGLDHRVSHSVDDALQVGTRTNVRNAPEELGSVELLSTRSCTLPSSEGDSSSDHSPRSHDRTQHLVPDYPRMKTQAKHTHDASPRGAASAHPKSEYCTHSQYHACS